MHSKKYDKKGSIVEDLVKPLESLLYQSIRHLKGYSEGHIPLESFAETRKIIPEMSELIVRVALLTDTQISPRPCRYLRLDEHMFRLIHFGYACHLCPKGGWFILGPYRCEWNGVSHLEVWLNVIEGRASVLQAFDVIRREHGLQ